MAKIYPHAVAKPNPRWRVLASQSKGPECRFPGCGAHATHRVDIQVDEFQANDLSTRACDEHRARATELAEAEHERLRS